MILLYLEGAFDNVRQHFWLSNCRRGVADTEWVGSLLVEATLQHTGHMPTTENYTATNVISAECQKPWHMQTNIYKLNLHQMRDVKLR